MPIGQNEVFQRVKTRGFFPSDLTLEPTTIDEIYLNNVFTRTLSLGTLWTSQGQVLWRGTLSGEAKVKVVGTGYERYEVKTGTAPDTYNTTDLLRPAYRSSIWDILIESNDAIVSFRNPEDTGYMGDIILPVGVYSIDINTTECRIKNRSTGSNATYQIVGYA